MPTTVHFASNRVLTGPADASSSYGPNIQPPSLSGGMTYGTAFVAGTDVSGDKQGQVTALVDTQAGGFPPGTMADLSAAGRNLLVFLHGFDNSFADAITRAAFNRDWMAASGVPEADTTVVAFSWPSLGQLAGFPDLDGAYRRDQSMARLSGIHLMTFLDHLEPVLRAARAGGQRTFLLAHSMGNLALQSAVENWFLHGNGDAELFDLAILAAADCGDDAFDQPNRMRLGGLPRLARRVSIWFSRADHVLLISAFLNGGAQRLGQNGPRNRSDASAFPPAIFRMEDATGLRDYPFDLMSSHQYYRRSPAVRARIAADMGRVAVPVA